jgi:hypothetical protein
VQAGKDNTCKESGRESIIEGIEEPVGHIGIQGHLLEQAKGGIAEDPAKLSEVRRQAVKRTEPRCRHEGRENKGGEDSQALASRRPQIVGSPAERFRRVAVQRHAYNEPNRENNPGIGVSDLQAPDVAGNVRGQPQRFCES